MPDLRVLVVEDEPLLRRQLCGSLRELWPDVGHIVEAESGTAATRQIAEAVPDIAFLDINLPDMSGIDIRRFCVTAVRWFLLPRTANTLSLPSNSTRWTTY